MSIAEALPMPAARAPLVPPTPPRAPEIHGPAAAAGGDQRQRDRELGASAPMRTTSSRTASFIAPASSSTRRTRSGTCWSTITRTTPARPPASACCGRCSAKACCWRKAAPGSTSAARWRRRSRRARSATLVPHMLAATDETVAELDAASDAPGRSARGDAADDAGDRRPHHVLVRHGRHGKALRDFVMEYGERLAQPAFARSAAAAVAGRRPQDFSRALFPQALDRASSPC